MDEQNKQASGYQPPRHDVRGFERQRDTSTPARAERTSAPKGGSHRKPADETVSLKTDKADKADKTGTPEKKAPKPDKPVKSSVKKSGLDAGQVLIIVLIALAVIASIIMLLGNSTGALKIALLAALWAAVLGVFLVARYHGQATEATRNLESVERMHQVELEEAWKQRDDAQNRAALSSNGGTVTTALDPESAELIKQIRSELAVVREQLEELSGREFGYEPAALQAEARRILEVEARARDLDESTAPAPKPATAVGTGGVTGAPSVQAVAGKVGRETPKTEANPLSALIAENQRREAEKQPAASTGTTRWEAPNHHQPRDYHGHHERPEENPLDGTQIFEKIDVKHGEWHRRHEKPQAGQQVAPQAQQAKQSQPEHQERGGRRRRDENQTGLSVADLMKNLNKDAK